MFSKELENLIQATLEDGQLSDIEKKALIKRAQNEGVDLDELEIYIDSLLQRRTRELNEQKEVMEKILQQKKTEAYGEVCPGCGKQVPPLTLQCECGYEFVKQKRVSAVEELSKRIAEIMDAPYQYSPGGKDDERYKDEVKARDQRILDMVTVAPIPNTKEDLIDFLALSAPNSKHKGWIFGTVVGRLITFSSIIIVLAIAGLIACGGSEDGVYSVGFIAIYAEIASVVLSFYMDKETLRWNKNTKVWRAKFDQALLKARSLRADSDFTQRVDYYEKYVYGKKGKR